MSSPLKRTRSWSEPPHGPNINNASGLLAWPLHAIAITNIVWYIWLYLDAEVLVLPPVFTLRTLVLLAADFSSSTTLLSNIAIKKGREETIYCAIVRAIRGGSGVPNQRECLHRISLIRAHNPCTKRICWRVGFPRVLFPPLWCFPPRCLGAVPPPVFRRRFLYDDVATR